MRMAEAFGDPAERNAVGAAKDGFFFKEENMKKASKSRKRINRIPSKHVIYFSCKGWQLWFMRHVAFDRCLFALLARLEVLMSANYGRRLFTWDRCSFFLVCGCFCMECVLFFTLLLLCSSLNSKIFILRRSNASFLVCFTRSGASVTEPSCTIKTTEKKIKKKRGGKRQPGRHSRNEILLDFLLLSMVQHCCFCRMQALGNGINWKKIHSPGIKHFLSHAFSRSTGLVLEGFIWDKIGKCQSICF